MVLPVNSCQNLLIALLKSQENIEVLPRQNHVFYLVILTIKG